MDPPAANICSALSSLCGLACIGVLFAVRGVPKGPGLVEVVGIAGAFFGGTAVLSARALLKRDQG